MRRRGGKVELSLPPAADYASKVDSDLLDFTLTSVHRCVNHLVCAGTGELEDRAVVHFFADAAGNVSHTQTLFGVDEIAALYDYSNADAEKLEEEGRKKLKEMQTAGSVEVDAHDDMDVDVGDVISARDNAHGRTVTATVAKKVVKVSRGVATFSYEVGSETTTRTSSSGRAESAGGHAYLAGKGTLGGVKTTSEVTSAAGYTPAPIIDGVPYYKDTNTTYADATQGAHGLMTAADKKKLDGVASGANNYSHPTAPGNKHIPAGGAAGQILAWASDGTAQWQAEKDTTYGDFKGATSAAAGSRGLVPAPAMGAATRYLRSDGTWQVPPYPTIDSAISPTSANPVQNKAVSAELGKKAPLASPSLTGSPTAPTPAAGSNNTQLATTAFVQNAVNAAVTNAAAYQGAANSYTEIVKTAYKPGWYWFVRTAGEYAGQQCESGDMIIANKAKGASVSDTDFDIIQSNVDYVTANDVKVWFA